MCLHCVHADTHAPSSQTNASAVLTQRISRLVVLQALVVITRTIHSTIDTAYIVHGLTKRTIRTPVLGLWEGDTHCGVRTGQ